jgi:hypothetical protein
MRAMDRPTLHNNLAVLFPSSESEALKLFLEKFVARIIPEYMSQRDFLTCVANDAFLAQVID